MNHHARYGVSILAGAVGIMFILIFAMGIFGAPLALIADMLLADDHDGAVGVVVITIMIWFFIFAVIRTLMLMMKE